MSALLPSSEYTEYLLQQYSSMQKHCSTNLPVTTYKTTLLVSPSATPVTTTATVKPTSSCAGQLIQPVDPPLGCWDLSDKYNVSTGAVVHATQHDECHFTEPLCLPKPCELDTIWDKTSW